MKSRHLDKYMPRVVEGLDAPVDKRSNAATVLDRQGCGASASYTAVSYMSDARMGLSRGEGRLEDLSKTGCKIIGPLLMVGTLATVVIHVDDDKPPLCLSEVEVTWTNSESFGVRFPKLKAEDRQRLQELVLRFATFRGQSEEHTAFRLA